MTTPDARVVLQEGPRALRASTLPLPVIGVDDGLLRIEACGLCGTDLEQYAGSVAETLELPYPIIPGHEIVGTIVAAGPTACARWNIMEGDRVAVEPMLSCGRCSACIAGRACTRHRFEIYGLIPTSRSPGLWGGYADHLYLHPDSVVHRLAPTLAPEIAVLFNPLANAIEWSVLLPNTQIGDSVLVLGAGQRGLCCVAALRARGAGTIIVTGLRRDAHKLEFAMALGATATVEIESEDLASRVNDLTGGAMVDIAVDTTPGSITAFEDALRLVRPGGVVVIGGVKHAPAPTFSPDLLIIRDLTLRGGNSASHRAYEQALTYLSRSASVLAPLHTHAVPLDRAEHALRLLAGDDPSEHAVAVCITP